MIGRPLLREQHKNGGLVGRVVLAHFDVRRDEQRGAMSAVSKVAGAPEESVEQRFAALCEQLRRGRLTQKEYGRFVRRCTERFAREQLRLRGPKTPSSMILFAVLLVKSANQQDHPKTQRLLKRLDSGGGSIDVSASNMVVEAHLRHKDVSGAEEWLASMKQKGLKPCLHTYEMMFGAYVRRGDLVKLRALDREFEQSGLSYSQTIVALLSSAFSKEASAEESLRLFNKIKDTDGPVDQHLNNIVKSLSREGDPEAADELLQRLENSGKGGPSVHAYNFVLTQLMRKGMTKRANRLFSRMKGDKNVPDPDVYSYSMMLRIFGRAKQMYRVDELFYEMQERSVKPNTEIYNSVIEGWVKNDRIDRAEEVFEEMKAAGASPSVFTYNHLVHGYSIANRVKDAKRALKTMEANNLQPAGSTYSLLLDGMVLNDKLTDAREVWEEMHDRNLRPTDLGYTAMIRCLVKDRALEKALQLFHEMKSKAGPSRGAYYVLLSAYGDTRGYGHMTAIQLFESARSEDKLEPFSSFLNESSSRAHVAAVHDMPSTVACIAVRWALFNLEADRDLWIVTSREHRLAQQAPEGGTLVKRYVQKMLAKLKIQVTRPLNADARLVLSQKDWTEFRESLDL